MTRPVVSLLQKAKDALVSKCPEKDPLDNHICYVLIACGKANESGDMEVEMMYEGDRSLASYLIESAQGLLEE